MPFNLGFGEMLVLAVVAILVFGGRLPEKARSLGRAINEFRRGISDEVRKIDIRPDISPRTWFEPEKPSTPAAAAPPPEPAAPPPTEPESGSGEAG